MSESEVAAYFGYESTIPIATRRKKKKITPTKNLLDRKSGSIIAYYRLDELEASGLFQKATISRQEIKEFGLLNGSALVVAAKAKNRVKSEHDLLRLGIKPVGQSHSTKGLRDYFTPGQVEDLKIALDQDDQKNARRMGLSVINDVTNLISLNDAQKQFGKALFRRAIDVSGIKPVGMCRPKGKNLQEFFSILQVKDAINSEVKGAEKVSTGPKAMTKDEAHSRVIASLREFANKQKIYTPDDWYQVSLSDLRSLLGTALKIAFDGSALDAVQVLFPAQELLPWKFSMAPMGFWEKSENRCSYLQWLGAELGVEKPEDWYEVNRSLFQKNYGGSLLQRMSHYEVLAECFPKIDWKPWLFKKAPNKFWKNKDNHRIFLEWIARKEGLSISAEGLSRLRSQMVKPYGVSGMLNHYKNFVDCLISVFPEIKFDRTQFFHQGRGFWQKKKNRREFLIRLGKKLGFSKQEDWYALTERDLEQNNGISLIPYHDGSVAQIVIDLLPEYDFNEIKFDRTSKYQERLHGLVSCLLPGIDVFWNFKHPEMRFESTDQKMELDIFVPDLELAFEYQGKQHYEVVEAWGGKAALDEIQSRDGEKRSKCSEIGIRLIEVRYDQWDGTPEGVLELIAPILPISSIEKRIFWEEIDKKGLLQDFGLAPIWSTTDKDKKLVGTSRKTRDTGPPLSIEEVLRQADSFNRQNNKWPKKNLGLVFGDRPLTWIQVDNALRKGVRGLPGGSSLAQLLFEERSVSHHLKAKKLTESLILRWADLHHRRTGQWPSHNSGEISNAPGETWSKIRNALVRGSRGLRGGSSIEKLLWENRGVKGQHAGNQLTEEKVLRLSDLHYKVSGSYPSESSDWELDGEPDSWAAISAAMKSGGRGMNGGETLAQFLERQGRKKNPANKITLTRREILAAADQFFDAQEVWPNRGSGKIDKKNKTTWAIIDNDLKRGRIEDLGKSSLAQLLESERGRFNSRNAPKLTIRKILSWCDEYQRINGKYPTQNSPALPRMKREKFVNIDAALRNGLRGLPIVGGLAALLREHRDRRDNRSAPPLTKKIIIEWMIEHYRSTNPNVWPKSTDGDIDFQPGEKWRNVNAVLHRGGRGLPGGNSLAKLRSLAEKRLIKRNNRMTRE